MPPAAVSTCRPEKRLGLRLPDGAVADRLATVLLILFGSAALTFGHDLQDADGVLPAIMSVQRLTWYYWNQNRFANLLPLLASPVRDVAWNLLVQVFLRQVCGFVSILFALQLLGSRERRHERFLAAVTVLMLAAPIFVSGFFNPAVPQPESCAAFALGLLVLERRASAAPARVLLYAASGVLFWVAFLVNLSLVALVVPLGILFRVFRVPSALGRPAGVAVLLLAAGLAVLHGALFEPRTPTGFHAVPDALNRAAVAVLSGIDLTRLALLMFATLGVLALLKLVRRDDVDLDGAPVTVPIRTLLVIAMLIATATLYADTVWAQLNQDASKYFNIMQLFLVVLPASSAIGLLSRAVQAGGRPGARWRSAPTARLRRWGLLMAAAGSVAWHAGPPGRIGFVDGNPVDPVAIDRDLPGIVAAIPPGRPTIVAGDYWTATLIAYARLARRHGGRTYATAAHWEPMRPAIRRALLSGEPVTLLCLAPEAPDCLAGVLRWSGLAAGNVDLLRLQRRTRGHGAPYTVLSVIRHPG